MSKIQLYSMSGIRPSSMNLLKIAEAQIPPLSSPNLPQENMNGNGTYLQNGNEITTKQFESILTLNIGGTLHTTRLSTLLKYPNSMLAAMFSGRHNLATDDQGRYFIDRDGKLFDHILNFLRDDRIPPLSLAVEVYEEAQYYNITPLIDLLSRTCPVASQKIRRLFLEEVPDYDVNLDSLLEKALGAATFYPNRVSKLRVCVYKEESPVSAYDNSLLPLVPGEGSPNSCQMKHRCEVALTFGPWSAAPDVYDLIHCIKDDLAKRGYFLECQCIGVCDQHLIGQFYCKRPIYEFKFKWW